MPFKLVVQTTTTHVKRDRVSTTDAADVLFGFVGGRSAVDLSVS